MGDQRGFETMLADLVRRVMREELQAHSSTTNGGNISTPPDGEREYLTLADAADVAGLHVCTIRSWIRDGSLKAYRAGRIYRVLRSDLDVRLTRDATNATPQETQSRLEAILAKHAARAA